MRIFKPVSKPRARAMTEGDRVADSPIGPGVLTGFSARGFPKVNEIAVVWLKLDTGAVFDPLNRLSRPPAPRSAIEDIKVGAKL